MTRKTELEVVIEAIRSTWDGLSDVPFPLYDREVRALAEAVIEAIARAKGQPS